MGYASNILACSNRTKYLENRGKIGVFGEAIGAGVALRFPGRKTPTPGDRGLGGGEDENPAGDLLGQAVVVEGRPVPDQAVQQLWLHNTHWCVGGKTGADQALENGDRGCLPPVEEVGGAAAVRGAESCCDWNRAADLG